MVTPLHGWELEKCLNFREPLIIPDLSLPPRNKYGINSGGSPVISKTYGFLLEFIPMKIGAGMTFLEVNFKYKEFADFYWLSERINLFGNNCP